MDCGFPHEVTRGIGCSKDHICQRILVSDRNRKFMSTLVLSLCEVFDITRQHRSSYHPQANELVERANSTLIKSFRAYCVIRTSIIGLRNFLEF